MGHFISFLLVPLPVNKSTPSLTTHAGVLLSDWDWCIFVSLVSPSKENSKYDGVTNLVEFGRRVRGGG